MDESIHIDWQKYCDKIYCIHCVNYEDRMQGLEQELRRVGIWESGILEIRENYKNPVDNFIKGKMGVDPRSLIMPLFIETYRIISEAKYKGFKRIAIMEDDVRFLKDKERIIHILNAIPSGANCIQLSRMSSQSKAIANNWNKCLTNRINDYFVKGDGHEIWSGAFYMLSAKGFDQLLEIMSHNARNPDGLFHLMKGVAICTEDIVIQKPMINSVRGSRWTLEAMSTDADIFGTKTENYAS